MIKTGRFFGGSGVSVIEIKYDKLKAYLEGRDITLRELEKKSGVSRSQISDISNNRHQPTVLTLEMIAEALNVKITDLYEKIKH